jgi:hypothetical protein
MHRNGECPLVSCFLSMGFDTTDQEIFCSLIHIQISCSEKAISRAQGALIQVQQGLGKHMATKFVRAWNKSYRTAG